VGRNDCIKGKGKDTSAYETLMSKVEGSGKDNKSFTTPIYMNNPALQNLEKHRQALGCLKGLFEWGKERKILPFFLFGSFWQLFYRKF